MASIDRTTLNQLTANAKKTLENLRVANNAAYVEVSRSVGEQRKRLATQAAASAPAEVVKAVAALDPVTLASGKLADAVGKALDKAGADAATRASVLGTLKQLEPMDPGEVRSDVPLAGVAALQPELARGELVSIADRVRLRAPAIDALVDAASSVAAVDDAVLTQLVSKGRLTNAEAGQLGTRLSFYNVAAGNTAVGDAIAAANFPALQGTVADVRDLLRVPTSEIVAALNAARVTPDPGQTLEQIATGIRDRVIEQYPAEALFQGLRRLDTQTLAAGLTRIQPLVAANRDRIGVDPMALDLSAIPQAERQGVVAAYGDLIAVTRQYPGLGLERIVSAGGDAPTVARAVQDRIALVDNVIRQNPGIEFLALDYGANSQDVINLKMEGIAIADRKAVLSALKGQQRVFAVTGSPGDAATVMRAGYSSALTIANDDKETFQRKTGLSADKATLIHSRALETMAGIGAIVGSAIDAVRGGFERMPFGNVGNDVSDALRQLDGYADLFGPQDYCSCTHCSSILSPAAYFVDLMYFVEERVLTNVFTGARATHALNLRVRRPDLWTVELTCENTNTVIPTLEVINEILESYIAKQRNPAIDLSNRPVVRTLVYGTALPNALASFVTPFVLPVATADAYIELFDLSRAAILRAFGAPEPRVTAAALRMSRATYDRVLTPDTGVAFLSDLYRVNFVPGAGGVIPPVDVPDFLRAMPINREQLASLAATRFVTSGGANPVTLRSEKSSPASVQNDIERIVGLKVEVLDRMQRFIRLWRHTSWSIDELDLVLHQRVSGGAPPLDGNALADIVATRELTERFAIPVDVACALWGVLPTREIVKGRRSLLDRSFNNRPYTLTEGNIPQHTLPFIAPAFRLTPVTGTNNTLQRLLLGLQVDDTGLAALVSGLEARLGCNLTSTIEAERAFNLSYENLTLLYRHATLARVLRRSIPDLFRLITFAGIAGGAVQNLADVRTLIAFDDWIRSTELTLDDLAFATTSPVHAADRYPDAVAIAAELLSAVSTEGVLRFADTVLAFVPGVTEEMSRQIFADNAALFDTFADGTLQLKATVAPTTVIAVPVGTPPAVAAAVLTAVMQHHTANILPPRLATALGVTTDKLTALASMAGIDFGHSDFATALQGGAVAPLENAVRVLSRLVALFKPAAYTTARLAFLRDNRALVGVAVFNALTVANVQAITRYQELIAPPPSDTDPPPDPVAVEDALLAFTPATKFSAVSDARLAQALGTLPTITSGLPGPIVLGNNAIDALFALATAVKLISSAGLDLPTVALLASETPADLAAGAEALISALARRYPEESDQQARLEPKDDTLRSLKRDALADLIVRESSGRFSSISDLYDYFLLDVELQGCAKTSRVVAAISSVQTYVHRILLNLEQDRQLPTAPTHVHVMPDRIPQDEWVWRKNYRVWEANRKVFLWPENYIEPELRDDKTPLFQTLEDALLQQDINEQNVLDAYGDYLSGFESSTMVTIAGAYHEFHGASQTDILHVFGATSDDPPEYYYWTVHNLHYSRLVPERRVTYSARKKIDVSIPVRKVTPVVYLGRLFVFWTEVQTAPRNQVQGGNSSFVGYKHKVRVRFISLRLDGKWTPPQNIQIDMRSSFHEAGGVLEDRLYNRGGVSGIPFFSSSVAFPHMDAREDYTLRGPGWDAVAVEPIWNGDLVMNMGGLWMVSRADLFDRKLRSLTTSQSDLLRYVWNLDRTVLHVGDDGSFRRLYAPTSAPQKMGAGWILGASGFQSVVADVRSLNEFLLAHSWEPSVIPVLLTLMNLDAARRGSPIGTLRLAETSATGVAGVSAGLILASGPDALYVHRDAASPRTWRAVRLGTTLVRDLSRTLFVGGVDQLLDITSQKNFREGAHLLIGPTNLTLASPVGGIDFNGALGVYFREIFFHIPFLIANNLNSRQKYAAAQSWYHYIFDPTAPLDPGVTLAGLDATQRQRVMRDRVWRYIQFRNLNPPRLREILTDDAAIEAYKKDPFNPHAIARLRLSAYQKAVVMKYVSNLIDWGDSLFRLFTMESVNEAIVLYAMASEILGRRPANVGECGLAAVQPRSYQRIRPWIGRGSEFLLEVESVIWIGGRMSRLGRGAETAGTFISYTQPEYSIAANAIERHMRTAGPEMAAAVGTDVASIATNSTMTRMKVMAGAGAIAAGATTPIVSTSTNARATAVAMVTEGLDPSPSKQMGWRDTRTAGWEETTAGPRRWVENAPTLLDDFREVGQFGWSVVRQLGPIFCVPENRDLEALWRRVEDRLFKIRHCRDINGERRDLALFAPEIDPRMLVRARAAGLSIEDVLRAATGNLPPYRFAYLIEKAKQHVATVQAFGAQLLGALERRDVEELTRLRNTQQLNVLRFTTRVREWEVQSARDGVEQLKRQQTAVEYRRDYYAALQETDLLPWERTQQVLRHTSTVSYVLGALFGGTAGILHLIPQLGSPFAMKYGGVELGQSTRAMSEMFRDTAKLTEVLAASAGLEAGFERRREGWDHQEQLASHELKQIEKQLSAAELRVKIAERSLELHQNAIEEQDEIIEFFRDKFSNLGRLVWLSTTLQGVFRQAFNTAHSMAKLAERAYRFERNDETTELLHPTYWNSEHAGLLSGEALMADLLDLERRFIETNYRTLEIEQPFSVLQLSPAALVALRETGECEVEIPEVAFDFFYPGQYRRRIRAVRLTIPCVTGPYTNVAATLTLRRSFIRSEPQLGAANLVEVPTRHSVSVATSTAQSDAGVFDFSFRDERYMPFEGAGAISTWAIKLPRNFRPMDYRSITDVIIHISYTALEDGVLRDDVQSTNAALEGAISNVLSTEPLARAVSLRQEFSAAFMRAMSSPAGTEVELEIDERFLPIFLRGRVLTVVRALLLLRPAGSLTGTGFSVRLNTHTTAAFAAAPDFPGHRQADVAPAFAGGLIGRHRFSIQAGGDLAPTLVGSPAVCDPQKLLDLMLYVELRL